MPLSEQLERWQREGLIDTEQARRIAEFERRTQAGEEGAGRGVSFSEVVAYVGVIVVLVGLGFLIGSQYERLSEWARIGLFAVTTAAALAVGLVMESRAGSPAAARARAAAFTVVVAGVFTLTLEVLADHQRIGSAIGLGTDLGGDIMLAGLIAAVVGAILLWRSLAALVAVSFGAALFVASAGLDAHIFPNDLGWPAVLPFLATGLVLGLVAEPVAARSGRGAAEVLRFGAILAPALAALLVSAPNRTWLELVALAIGGLGFALAVVRASPGYAVGAGLAVFIVTVEIGLRHFATTVGFPIVLILAGLLLLGLSLAMVRLLPRLRRSTPRSREATPPDQG